MLLVLFSRFLGNNRSYDRALMKLQSPEEWVEGIQAGDLHMRNQFITEYQPFIAKVTSRFCKRYIDPSHDDEYSIALAAFNEAINQFSVTGGASFLGFSETVIRRRLIDYVRKEQKHGNQVAYSAFDLEDEDQHVSNPLENRQALDVYALQIGAEERRNEIVELDHCLSEFGIQFMDLAAVSPKHADSRTALIRIGIMLAEDAELMGILLFKRMLPIKELLAKVNTSRKTLERNRKYIVTIALIHSGPYPYLKDYLTIAEPAERSDMAYE